MSKFKVGDKVRCVRSNPHNDFGKPGQIYTVAELLHSGDIRFEEYGSRHPSCDPARFELVEGKESELERLVRVANEGTRASAELYKKHHDSIEAGPAIYTGKSVKGGSYFVEMFELRIKPKPAFEPFTVGNGWNVHLEGNTLAIGCKKFNASKFAEFLQGYIKGVELTVCNYPSQEITHTLGTRSGIQFTFRSEKHVLRWEDADRILAALEKAGIK